MRSNWMSSKDWKDFGYPLSSASDEACKLYDANLSQIVGWYSDPSLGGLSSSMTKMLEADPNFVMGHVMSIGTNLTGTTFVDKNNPVRGQVADLVTLSEKQPLTDIEQLHIKAIQQLVDSNLAGALESWECILRINPLDMLAVRLAFFGYYFMGKYAQQRDMLAGVIQSWNKDMPLYGYLHGFHAFALQETNFYDAAEAKAHLALDFNKNDVYASHSLLHVLEMQSRADEGLSFLSGTQNNWELSGGTLTCHVHWHGGLFHIEKGNFEDALGIFDTEILPRYQKSKSLGNLTDGSSLLFRLEMEGVNVGKRWQQLNGDGSCRTQINTFNDAHVLMTCLGADDYNSATSYLDQLKDSLSDNKGFHKKVSESVIIPLCEAFIAYDKGDFDSAVDLTFPIRYDIIDAGGSNAQRDIYNLFLIDSALKSTKKDHNAIGRQLLLERKSLNENSCLTDRLMERVHAKHLDL